MRDASVDVGLYVEVPVPRGVCHVVLETRDECTVVTFCFTVGLRIVAGIHGVPSAECGADAGEDSINDLASSVPENVVWHSITVELIRWEAVGIHGGEVDGIRPVRASLE